ncbi:MAG TPA: pyridoxal phosphate-dependent aminotransferase [Thermoplasmata archaeon]|nr:pyridoxal phosphate-dependent aminotransferase [Thermoplasmata archaeon]
MDFPIFEHLHLYEGLRELVNISYSNVAPFRLGGFERDLPPDLELEWTDPDGMPDLRRAIARRHGVPPDRVLVTSGATEANFLVNAALVRPGDRVVVDAPTYSPLRDCPRGFGASVLPVLRDCGTWSLDLDRWNRATKPKTRLLVFANLNNPTSAPLSRGDLRALGELAEERESHVLVDETFRELAFAGTPPSAATLGPRMISISTVTKLYGLGALRVGWIVAAPEILRRIRRIKDYTTVGGSSPGQILATWALQRHRRFAQRARAILDRNRTIVRERFDAIPSVEGGVPSAGTVLFPHCSRSVDRLASRLVRKYRTVIAPGRFFGVKDHFRLGLGGDSAELAQGLANLERALKDVR